MSAIAPSRALTTLESLLIYAVKGPSSHNTQPWRFRLDEPSRVFIYADRTRGLPVNDPDGRELIMSCGAALENLTIAAREFGFDADVHVWPDPDDGDLVACVTLAEGRWPTDEEAALFVAIDERHTQRGALSRRAVDPQIVRAMEGAAASVKGTRLVTIRDEWRWKIAALVEAGDRQQFRNAQWRAELASWLRAPDAGDGLTLPGVPSLIARTIVRSIDVGGRAGVRDASLVDSAPMLAVLGTDNDDPASWVGAGRALELVLLTAAFKGVQAGFLNQPCQVETLRRDLRQLVGCNPQALLRFGHPLAPTTQSPRRPLDAVLDESHARGEGADGQRRES